MERIDAYLHVSLRDLLRGNGSYPNGGRTQRKPRLLDMRGQNVARAIWPRAGMGSDESRTMTFAEVALEINELDRCLQRVDSQLQTLDRTLEEKYDVDNRKQL
jgi:hypothetical protein